MSGTPTSEFVPAHSPGHRRCVAPAASVRCRARLGAFFEIGRRPDACAFAKPTDNVPLGILYMILATVLFAVSSAIAKWQAAIYPVGEVMFFRSISALVVCAAVVLPVTGFAVFATRRQGAHIARGLSQSISQTFTVIAFSLMPLAGADRDQLLGAAVGGAAFDPLAEGARRPCALDACCSPASAAS